MLFNTAQLEAINTNGRDICVIAGAGSGKTGVLVERFVRIVCQSLSGELKPDDRAGVDEILVITFTDRATREMKARIVARLNELGMTEQRRQLEASYIATIHGFCSRLLHEYPFEAGIDPEFKVMDDAAARGLLRQTFLDLLERGFEDQEPLVTAAVHAFIGSRAYTGHDLDIPATLAAEVEAVYHKLRSVGVTLQDLEETIRSPANPISSGPVDALLLPATEELAACVEELKQIALGAAGSVRSAVTAVLQAVQQMSLERDVWTRVQNIQMMSSAAITAGGMLAAPQHGISALLDRIRLACASVSELFGASADLEAQSGEACRRILRLVGMLWGAYAAEKRRSGLLDADDLQTECVRLLETSPEIRAHCRRKFRHLFVDEFQDTNRLQAKLVELVHTEGLLQSRIHTSTECDTDVSHNYLFIVGDMQQSIYGFRGAEPDLFSSVSRQFRNRPDAICIALTENYRSRAEILNLTNQVIRSDSTGTVHLRCAAEYNEKSQASIELLISSGMARRDYVHCEADAIARLLRSVVEENHVRISARFDERCGEPIHYGDIALLMRGLTDVRIYEEAFARHGVPALVTAGGRGYFARFEIRDLLNVLELLDSPLHDVALLAVLRSPFVGVELDTLVLLGQLAHAEASDDRGESRAGCLYPALGELLASALLPDSEREKIAPFLEILTRLAHDVDRIPVGRLIDRLVTATRYDVRLVCRLEGRRKLANVRKLTQIAHESDGISVRRFIDQMRDRQFLTDREGDAPIADEGAGVVRIMTMHAAKGLEFPMVVLPDLSRGLISPETGMFVCEPESRAIGSRICGEPDIAYRAIVKRRQQREQEEYLRLLYVAITRAREHLVLCGNVGRNRGFNWADIVFPALGVSTAPAATERRTLLGGIDALITPIEPLAATAATASATHYATGDRIVSAILNGETIDEIFA